MFSQNKDETKLDWMYKGANSLVDREDYLLGRSIDKTLEQINFEEKQKTSNQIAQPKNHVEHECIPPSIRDYNKITLGEQVDLAAKLQEDPLVLIRKREEESRKQFLQNPIQLKKLQKALKSQAVEGSKSSSRKSKKSKKKKKKHSKDIDAKLMEKLSQLRDNPLGLEGVSMTSNTKKNDMEKNKDDGDGFLIHKFNKLKGKLSEKDIKAILEGQETSSSEDSSSDEKSNFHKKEQHSTKRKEKQKIRKDEDIREARKFGKARHKRSHSSSSDTTSSTDLVHKQRHSFKKGKVDELKRESSRHEREEYRRTDRTDKHRNRSWSEIESNERKREEKRNASKNHKKKMSNVGCQYKRKNVHHKQNSSSASSSSDEEYYTPKLKQNFGLVTADGHKIELKNREKEKMSDNKHKSEQNKQQADKPPVQRPSTKLTEEEKEKRRREMMANATWRDRERERNVKKYRDEDSKDTKPLDYDPEFIHHQLRKAAGATSVENRIKSNVNNIQRSSAHMDRNFSKRH